MNTTFAFWFLGSIISMVIMFIAMFVSKINNKFFHKNWDEKIEYIEGASGIFSFWCTGIWMMWVFA